MSHEVYVFVACYTSITVRIRAARNKSDFGLWARGEFPLMDGSISDPLVTDFLRTQGEEIGSEMDCHCLWLGGS